MDHQPEASPDDEPTEAPAEDEPTEAPPEDEGGFDLGDIGTWPMVNYTCETAGCIAHGIVVTVSVPLEDDPSTFAADCGMCGNPFATATPIDPTSEPSATVEAPGDQPA